jgi:monoamine oxidase
MEELTRVKTNLALLKMHQQQNVDAGRRTIDVELVGLRVGDFVLVTFPGELAVQIGLDIKQASPHALTFVAGYTNGYIYYAPTAEQLKNVGNAQEDSDCLLAPQWQALFESKAAELLKKL